uniref:R13L1/DRL21-like LRR repeat region domain-containing protein n=1 Tax=Chenopodium quinoa TaxID=63459 RepID=A0A803NBC0_CHEQI
MTALKDLDVFIVGKNNGIDSLPPLNITGYVDIEFSKWRSDAVVEAQRANLKDNQHLISVEMDRMLLSLQLPPNLKNISVQQYKGVEMPRRWLDGLSKLVFIRIEYCSNCRVLPHMSQQPHLKELYLSSFDSLEYVEDEDDVSGWTRPSKGDDVGETRHWLFPRLLKMNVDHFSKLMSMPLAPKLESLRAQVINWKVFESNLTSVDDEEASSSSTNLFTSLKELDISTIEDGPTSLTIMGNISVLDTLIIEGGGNDLEEELSQSIACLTTLQKLEISSFQHSETTPRRDEQPLLAACPDLKERYEMPNGQDCHLLQHIPMLYWILKILGCIKQQVIEGGKVVDLDWPEAEHMVCGAFQPFLEGGKSLHNDANHWLVLGLLCCACA